MDNHSEKKPWFPRKRFGDGWGVPNTIVGWLVLIGYFALVVAPVSIWTAANVPTFWAGLYYVILSVAFIAIVCIKGELHLLGSGGMRYVCDMRKFP